MTTSPPVASQGESVSGSWIVGIDIGGTFTDVVAHQPGSGTLRMAKVPSVPKDPLSGLESALRAVELGWSDVADLVHGTTMVTNAMVERKVAKVALVATEGFTDVLQIARQARTELYRLDKLPRAPADVPPELCFAAAERLDAEGAVLQPLSADAVEALAGAIERSGAESVAVSLLHAYINPEHEQAIGRRLANRMPYVSLSHEVSPEAREYERTMTTVLNASVMPLTARYMDKLIASVPPSSRVHLFHSAGGMASPEAVKARPLVLALSGPAAGAQAAADAAKALGLKHALSFDMGGTTTDVCLIVDGQVEIASGKRLAGRPIRQPIVAVESIGAGGGSLVKLGTGGLSIGPESAGADPGPVCYGRGGTQATITDANVVLGYLDTSRVLGGAIRMDPAAASRALEPMAGALGRDVAATALGVARVANATMARALRRVTVERGIDARLCSLIAFGGAGPMHACGLAREVGIRHIVVPIMSGGFSALGCIAADPSYAQQQTARLASTAWDSARFDALRNGLADRVAGYLLAAGHKREALVFDEIAVIRYQGQSYGVEVPYRYPADLKTLGRDFRAVHDRLYGYATDEPWIVESLRVRASVPSRPPSVSPRRADLPPPNPVKVLPCVFDAGSLPTPRYRRDDLPAGFALKGPAVVEDDWSTVVVEPGATLTADAHGHLHIRLGEPS